MADIGRKMVEIAQSTVSSVPAEEVHKRTNAGESLVILDVREPDEWANGHIEGATLLSRGRIEGRLEELIPDKDTAIITHWGGTGRSALAGQTLKAMGYTNVSYMDPGFSGWKEQGLPYVTPDSKWFPEGGLKKGEPKCPRGAVAAIQDQLGAGRNNRWEIVVKRKVSYVL